MCKPYLAYSASESAPVNPPFCEDGGRSGTRQFDPNRGETSESKGRRPPFKLVKVRSVPIKLGDACNLSRRLTPARARYLARLKAKRPINNSASDFQQLVQAALVTGARYGSSRRFPPGILTQTVAVRRRLV
jgi:hypothetical protein